jgi:transposase
MDEIYKRLSALEEENRILREIVSALLTENAELKAKLNKTSKNSNKPPSTDGFNKNVKNSRVRSGKPSGGQPGHAGKTKEITASPDVIIELKPQKECECGGEVVIQTDNYTVRQVTDIERVKVLTVEYRRVGGKCSSCGKVHKSSFPTGVESFNSYGENLKAMLCYLTNYQLLPLKRTTELVKDLFGLKVSEGTVVSAERECYENLEDAEGEIKEDIIESDVAGFDESGMRVAGKTYWLHSAGTKKSTVYQIHRSRGIKAMDEMGILPRFTGTAIHDHWKSYYHYTCAHGECNQHHLRTLKYLYEDLGCAWAFDMACLLLWIKHHVDLCVLFGAEKLEQEDIEKYLELYRIVLDTADNSTNAPNESRRMSKRLRAFEQETLMFMLDFAVPFTNNLAERDIRMPKAKQKISGCFRSEAGADSFARTRGFLSTAKKRGKNIFDGLVSVFSGNPSAFLNS